MIEGPTWRDAWAEALYGSSGFFRRHAAGDHFRTSVHASRAFSAAVAALARERGLRTIVDLGSGSGELVAAVEHSAPGEFELVGVDVGPRPSDLPPAVDWRPAPPRNIDGLLLANEYLDNVPCDLVEVDDRGLARVVHIDPTSGEESLGAVCDDPWLVRWWRPTEPGQRIQVGSARDEAWADAVARIDRGVAIAIDYGHRAGERPPYDAVRSYLRGREVDVRLDGSRDVTAPVAVDSVAARVGARLVRQRDALLELGLDTSRPPSELARDEPRAYVERLSRSAEAAELIARGGLGDFWWIISEH